jgi:hypothetical protein
MTRVGFEPTTSVFERSTVIGTEDKSQFHNPYMQGYVCIVCKPGMPIQVLKAAVIGSYVVLKI